MIRVTALILMLVAPVWGAPPKADTAQAAKQAYQLGGRFYAAEKFSAAAEAFLEAYRLQPNPIILYNVAQAYRKDGHFKEALAHYERFLAESQPAQRGNVDSEARHYIDEIKTYLGSQQTLLDRQTPATRPPERVAPMQAAPEKPPQAKPPEENPMKVTAAPEAVVATHARPPVYRRWYLWVPLAVGVVALGVGLGVGLQSNGPQPQLGTFTPMFPAK